MYEQLNTPTQIDHLSTAPQYTHLGTHRNATVSMFTYVRLTPRGTKTRTAAVARYENTRFTTQPRGIPITVDRRYPKSKYRGTESPFEDEEAPKKTQAVKKKTIKAPLCSKPLLLDYRIVKCAAEAPCIRQHVCTCQLHLRMRHALGEEMKRAIIGYTRVSITHDRNILFDTVEKDGYMCVSRHWMRTIAPTLNAVSHVISATIRAFVSNNDRWLARCMYDKDIGCRFLGARLSDYQPRYIFAMYPDDMIRERHSNIVQGPCLSSMLYENISYIIQYKRRKKETSLALSVLASLTGLFIENDERNSGPHVECPDLRRKATLAIGKIMQMVGITELQCVLWDTEDDLNMNVESAQNVKLGQIVPMIFSGCLTPFPSDANGFDPFARQRFVGLTHAFQSDADSPIMTTTGTLLPCVIYDRSKNACLFEAETQFISLVRFLKEKFFIPTWYPPMFRKHIYTATCRAAKSTHIATSTPAGDECDSPEPVYDDTSFLSPPPKKEDEDDGEGDACSISDASHYSSSHSSPPPPPPPPPQKEEAGPPAFTHTPILTQEEELVWRIQATQDSFEFDHIPIPDWSSSDMHSNAFNDFLLDTARLEQ